MRFRASPVFREATSWCPAVGIAASSRLFLNNLKTIICNTFIRRVWNNFHIDAVIGYLPLEDKIVCLDTFKTEDCLKILVGSASGELFLWQLQITDQNRAVDSEDHRLILQHRDGVTVVRFNRSCSMIVSSGEDRMFNIVDIETGMVIFKCEMPAVVSALCWAKDDKYLLMGDRAGVLYVWNMLEGMIQKEIRVHAGKLFLS